MEYLSSHECLSYYPTRKKRYSLPTVVKRLEVKARLSISNPRTETTYGNFTSRGQPHTPRAAIRGCATGFRGWSPSAGSVFGCGERLYPHTHRDICVCVWLSCTRGGGCLREERMCRCDNGLKHDAAGFHCSSMPVLCLLFSQCQREKPSQLELSLTEIIFLSKVQKLSKNCIPLSHFFNFLNFDELAAVF